MIGRDGETLEAIQFLLNRLHPGEGQGRAESGSSIARMYRSMREDKIVHHVRQLAERVRISGRLAAARADEFLRAPHRARTRSRTIPEVATWSPSDSARIKQITLLRRPAKKESAPTEKA